MMCVRLSLAQSSVSIGRLILRSIRIDRIVAAAVIEAGSSTPSRGPLGTRLEVLFLHIIWPASRSQEFMVYVLAGGPRIS